MSAQATTNVGRSLPWRTVVLGLQLLGIFPYTMSVNEAHSCYKFSLRICLWGIFVQMMIFSANGMFLLRMFFPLVMFDIGSVIYVGTMFVFDVSNSVHMWLLWKNSKQLASALEYFSMILNDQERGEGPHVFMGLLFTVTSLYFITYSIFILRMNSVIEIGFLVFVILCDGLCRYMTLEFYKMIFNLLAKHLHLTAENIVKLFASELPLSSTDVLMNLRETFKPDTNKMIIIQRLNKMESKIREVSHIYISCVSVCA